MFLSWFASGFLGIIERLFNLMDKEPTPVRPHHVEGAQAWVEWSPIKGTDTGRDLYEMLEGLIAEDPDAELIFVTETTDPICRECLATEGKCLAVLEEDVDEQMIVDMDLEVAKEHGWEMGKPYRVQDILDEIRGEAPGRRVFYAVAAIPKMTVEVEGQVCNVLDLWREDIRASKRKK